MSWTWRARLAALAAAAAAVASPCAAQDGGGDDGGDAGAGAVAQLQVGPPVGEPGLPQMLPSEWEERVRNLELRAERAIEALNRRGFYPDVSSTLSEFGLSGGGSFRYPSFGGSRIGTEIGAMWSVRGYREYRARIGIVGGSHDTLELDRPDGNVTTLFNAREGKTASASALYVEGVQRHFPQADFYGLGGGLSGPKTDFAASAASLELVGRWQATERAGFVGRAGVIDVSLGRGTNEDVPNLELLYDARIAPGLDAQEPWLAIGLGGAYDTRDSKDLPVQGFFLGGAIWHLESLRGLPHAFTRGALDLRFFEPLVTRSGIAAVRLLASADFRAAGRETPFYLQYWLGGSNTLRGYSGYRLRGEALLHASVEYRMRIATFFDLVPFVDVGTVGRTVGELRRSDIHVTPGVGLWLRDDDRFFARVDWAYGREGQRFLFSLGPSF